MKKTLLLALCMLLAAVSAQAQDITVKSPSPELKVEFRRCIATEGSAFIDILITNTSQRDTKIEISRRSINIYDDEGNIYNNENAPQGKYDVYIAVSNTDSQPLTSTIDIPAGIAYRARIMLSNGFDKYATMVQLLKISFNWNVFGSRAYGMWTGDSFELRNLPITRE